MSKGMLVDGGLHLEYESDFVVWESYFFTHSWLANIHDIFHIFFGSKWLSWKDLSISLQGNSFVGTSELQ